MPDYSRHSFDVMWIRTKLQPTRRCRGEGCNRPSFDKRPQK